VIIQENDRGKAVNLLWVITFISIKKMAYFVPFGLPDRT